MLLPPEHLESIAQATRSAFEEGNITPEELTYALAKYHPERDQAYLCDNAARRIGAFPILCCDDASAISRVRLGEGEIVLGSYKNMSHAFLYLGTTALGNETIFDITADQFDGGPKIYIGPLVKPWSRTRK